MKVQTHNTSPGNELLDKRDSSCVAAGGCSEGRSSTTIRLTRDNNTNPYRHTAALPYIAGRAGEHLLPQHFAFIHLTKMLIITTTFFIHTLHSPPSIQQITTFYFRQHFTFINYYLVSPRIKTTPLP